ncbi:MAG: hypothetical protein GXO92_02020 [FCB group bacterium]|nr:hypothetical protein [FCB group bacterium]
MSRLLLLVLFLIIGCSSKKDTAPPPTPDNPVVARVNGARLTLKEARGRLLAYDQSQATMNDIVSQWINEELLYQAALLSDLDRDETLTKMVQNYRRKLLGGTFLDSRSLEFKPITSGDVSSYYQENKTMFVRNADEARIYHFVLPTLKEARSVFRTLTTRKSGAQRKELFTAYRVDAITVKKGYLLPELDDLVFRAKSRARILGPVQTASGYHVIEVLERHSKGSQKSLNEVYDEIYQRLISEKRALANLRILDSLRLSSHIEVLMENINDQ